MEHHREVQSLVERAWFHSVDRNSHIYKPKLDAYEQRWVFKLSSYNFDLKYIPGPKNVVADALSHGPFTSSISDCLMQEPYNGLVLEAEDTADKEV